MDEIFQSQRHYGVAGWLSPAPFERKQWTDLEGNPIDWPPGELPENNAKWTPFVTEWTDCEGWLYGTNFNNLSNPREGGRASKRATDRVRQRKWILHEESNKTRGILKPYLTKSGRPVDVQRGVQEFFMFLSGKPSLLRIRAKLFLEIGSRRNFWEVLPWDPIAWFIVHAEHQEYLNSFESLQLRLNDCLTLKPDSDLDPLLEKLAMGAQFSRAAYGYPMAAGHIDSIESFIRMHAVHSRYFHPASGASIEANLDAVCRLGDLNREDIVTYDWANREYQPCHFLAVDKKRQTIVLAIRGSVEMGDLVTDISGGPLNVNIGGVAGSVHEGSMAAAIYVHSNTSALLKETIDRYPNWPIFVTGHSIGGGVASLVALLLKFEDSLPDTAGPIHCVALGSAAVMSENLAELCKDFVTSLVLRCDVVPRLSAFSLESMMVELVNASPAKRTISSVVQTASSAVQNIQAQFAQFKGLIEKEKKVNEEAVPDLRNLSELASDKEVVARAISAVENLPKESASPPSSAASAPRALNVEGISRRSFKPLFPPGRLLWLLGWKTIRQETPNKEPWWKQLQRWSTEKLDAIQRSAFTEKKPEGMEEKVVQDMTWLEDWISVNEPKPPPNESLPSEPIQSATSIPDNQETSEVKMVMIEAERKSFSRLLIHPTMIQDHLPNCYFHSIHQLQQQHRSRKERN